jgi:hypothetical protein
MLEVSAYALHRDLKGLRDGAAASAATAASRHRTKHSEQRQAR